MEQRNRFSLAGCRLIIYMMLAIFAAMPLVQAFHSHDSESISFSKDDQQLAKSHTDCHFCHQFSQNQPVPLLPIRSLSVLFFGSIPSIFPIDAVQELISLPGVSWTNKGPPAINA
ncbi:hypothetical protein [Pedobacter sp.]|uniref:hypothetical protein n=1 Tax=Pedobacter sp. TaxID=1411316 RepID=UPI003D7FECB2